jgi:hypothetical protein
VRIVRECFSRSDSSRNRRYGQSSECGVLVVLFHEDSSNGEEVRRGVGRTVVKRFLI